MSTIIGQRDHKKAKGKDSIATFPPDLFTEHISAHPLRAHLWGHCGAERKARDGSARFPLVCESRGGLNPGKKVERNLSKAVDIAGKIRLIYN